MLKKKPYLIWFLVISTLSINIYSKKVCASDLVTDEPVFVEQNYISLYFLPKYKQIRNYKPIKTFIESLAQYMCNNMNSIKIDCFVPKEKELDLIYANRFDFINRSEISDSIVPVSDFWVAKNTRYMIIANTKLKDNKSWVEMRLYRSFDKHLMIGKRYSGWNKSDFDEAITRASKVFSEAIIKDLK